MLTIGPAPLIPALLAALATTMVLAKVFGAPQSNGRFETIDGLRGYLAFFVFVHHSCIWYYFLRTGRWETPPSNLYTQLGQAAVAVFFMVTGFLFFSKLLQNKNRTIDWLDLYVSRVLRLAPLYGVAMLTFFCIVLLVNNGALAQQLHSLLLGMMRWLLFTIPGAPDLNGVTRSYTVMAGVTWSLPYEWFFYASLPVLGILAGNRVELRVIAFAAIGMMAMLMLWRPLPIHLWSFGGGIVAAVLQNIPSFTRFARRRQASFIVCACVLTEVLAFPMAHGFLQIALLSWAFCLVACGTDLFGVLRSSTSRMLGEMAYSIYLLHGLVLFVVFRFLIGMEPSMHMSMLAHGTVVVGLVPVLIILCFAAFVFIERPAMRAAPEVSRWLHGLWAIHFRRDHVTWQNTVIDAP